MIDLTLKYGHAGLWTVFLVLASGLLAVFSPAQAAVTIQLRPSVTVESDDINLGDISEIRSDDREMARRLSGIKIGTAPPAGQSRWVHPTEVRVRLKQFGIEEESYEIAATGPVKILRRHATVAPQRVNEAVKAFIQNHAPWKADQLKIHRLTYDDELIVPAGRVSLVVAAPKHTDWLGPVPFKVQVLVEGQAVRTVTAPATIEVWSNVVVAVKPLGRYQPVDADDIRIERMNLARVPSNVIMDPEQVLGRRTNRSIAANSVLRNDQVEMPPVIKRGDMVQMFAESSVLRVEAKGIARENGAPGDRIQIMNLSSKKIIYARVVDGQTVEVEF